MARAKYLRHIVRDFLVVCASIILALFLVQGGVIDGFLEATSGSVFLASFLAGAFFTFIFTIAPAGVALVFLGQNNPIWEVALFGALGAMCVDVIIIHFVRKDLAYDLSAFSHTIFKKHIIKAFHFGFLKWVAFVIGIILVTTPLPDELGLILIGLSKINSKLLPLVFFAAHFIGISALISIAIAI